MPAILLQTAAEQERERNEEEMKRQNGYKVTYGMTIQLLHCASDKFLTVYKREPAAIEKNSMRVALDREGNEGSYFDVEPHWKYSKRGNPVRYCSSICNNNHDRWSSNHAFHLCRALSLAHPPMYDTSCMSGAPVVLL